MRQRYKDALEAYKAIMLAPREPGESAFCKQPSNMRDKKWSKELRQMWPDFRAVRINATKNSYEIMKWCEENTLFFWTNESREIWYFSRHNDAVHFKLVYGGTEL